MNETKFSDLNLEDKIRKQISALPANHIFGTRKEIRYLPEILRPDEDIKGLTSGFMNRHTWLVICTSRRVIFLDKGWLFGLRQIETPIEKINSVGQTTGLFFGKIIIWDGVSSSTLEWCPKHTTKHFVNALNLELSKLTNPKISFSSANENLTDQLIKLAALKDRGILTEDEFQKQKKKLLV